MADTATLYRDLVRLIRVHGWGAVNHNLASIAYSTAGVDDAPHRLGTLYSQAVHVYGIRLPDPIDD